MQPHYTHFSFDDFSYLSCSSLFVWTFFSFCKCSIIGLFAGIHTCNLPFSFPKIIFFFDNQQFSIFSYILDSFIIYNICLINVKFIWIYIRKFNIPTINFFYRFFKQIFRFFIKNLKRCKNVGFSSLFFSMVDCLLFDLISFDCIVVNTLIRIAIRHKTIAIRTIIFLPYFILTSFHTIHDSLNETF